MSGLRLAGKYQHFLRSPSNSQSEVQMHIIEPINTKIERRSEGRGEGVMTPELATK